jgi:hypothetical protein
MKTLLTASVVLTFLLAGASQARAIVIYSENFDTQTVGASVTFTTSVSQDFTTFSPWALRLFDAAAVPSFGATIVSNSGGAALQQSITVAANGATATPYQFINGGSNSVNATPISDSETYNFSLDVAYGSGISSNNVGIVIAEYSSGNIYLTDRRFTLSTGTDTAYHTLSFVYTPTPGAVSMLIQLNPLMQPDATDLVGSTVFNVDNIQVSTVPEPSTLAMFLLGGTFWMIFRPRRAGL